MTLAKWFFDNSLVDNKEVRFYHGDWEFLRVLGQNPPLSARFPLTASSVKVLRALCSPITVPNFADSNVNWGTVEPHPLG